MTLEKEAGKEELGKKRKEDGEATVFPPQLALQVLLLLFFGVGIRVSQDEFHLFHLAKERNELLPPYLRH